MPKTDRQLAKKFPQYDSLILQLLFNRGLIEPEEIEEFLNPDYKKFHHDPFLFQNMEKAVELIIDHIKRGSKIVVYGDYDADGVTSSAIMLEILTTLKAKTEVYIPDRVTEGYGMNKRALKEIADSGASLIITVDNGIRNKDEVEYIKKLNMDVVITDHHVAPKEKAELPDCLIINPILAEEKYPFKYLAGVGVASKLALALIKKSKLSMVDKEKLEEKILDLVSVGTIADCVSLLGENRILVKKGLEVLNKTKRIGLQELIKIAKINSDKKIDSWNVGFQISPRLNAAGRMAHANTAFGLLVTKDRNEAVLLANDLNLSNVDRQKITEEIVNEITLKLSSEPPSDKIVVAIGPSIYDGAIKPWNEGIIGLVAGRICEKFSLPALVITGDENEIKGSGRSIEDFNLIKAVEASSQNLDKYGGHAAACGFSIKGKKNLEKFIEEIKRITNKQLARADHRINLRIESELDLSEVDETLLEIIEKFSPFGEDNERPIFASKAVNIIDIANMGIDGKHIKLKLRSSNSRLKNAIGFGQAEEWKDLKIGDKIDIAYFVDLNEFNGRREVQLRIVDIRPCEE